MKNLHQLVSLSFLVLACSGPYAVEQVGELKQAATRLPNTGLIPVPIELRSDSTATPVPAWDGTLPELMAADAWATCQQGTQRSNDDDVYEADDFLARLRDLMSGATCGTSSGANSLERWRTQRINSQCNADSSTGVPTKVTFSPHSRTGYELPAITTSDIPAASTTILSKARLEAQKELDVAEINLCMGQRLREYASSADTLFASGEDQRQLLEITRQRSQIAMLQYALVGQAMFGNDNTANRVDHPLQIIPIFDWLKTRLDTTRLGADFAVAIKLHLDSTRELADMFVRTAAAGENLGLLGAAPADARWGKNSARRALLLLMYGGAPIDGDPGIYTDEPSQPRYATTNVDSPEALTLLALARRADALNIKTESGFNKPMYPTATGDLMYRMVEAYLRADDCVQRNPVGTTCTFKASTVGSTNGYQASFLLWRNHRIKPEHATLLAQMLSESVMRSQMPGAWAFTGAHSIIQVTTLPAVAGTPQDRVGELGYFIHLDPAFQLVEWSTPTRARAGQQRWDAGWRLPDLMRKNLSSRMQGMVARSRGFGTSSIGRGSSNMGMRVTGASSAQAAARHSILRTAVDTTTPAVNFYQLPLAALPMIEAAVGPVTALLRPRVSVVATSAWGCGDWEFEGVRPSTCAALHQTTSGSGSTLRRTIDIELAAPSVQPYLSFSEMTGERATGGLEGTLPFDSNYSTPWGANRATVEAWPDAPLQLITDADPSLLMVAASLNVLVSPGVQNPTTIFTTAGSGATRVFSLLFDAVALDIQQAGSSYLSVDGKGVGLGNGDFNTIVNRAWAKDKLNWTKPLYDGFGLPTSWVPPHNPEVLATGTQSAVEYYLGSAARAAEEATQAVSSAVDNLLREEADSAAAQIANEKAQQINALEQQALCGATNPNCSLVMAQRDISSLLSRITSCTTNWCINTQAGLDDVLPHVVTLADPVWSQATATSAPEFSEFAGGTLQRKLVDQWNALRAVISLTADAKTFVQGVNSNVAWAEAELVAAQTSADGLKRRQALLCSEGVMEQAKWASTTISRSGDNSQDTEATGNSFNPGPYMSAIHACFLAGIDAQSAGVGTQIVHWDAMKIEAHGAVAEYLTQAAQAGADLRAATAELQQALAESALAKRRTDIEAKFAAAGLTTRFGSSRRFHSYDIWRARALLENARRLSNAARRSIERRFVVDLSTMTSPEPFVASPAEWVDTVFRQDLSPPSAVGLVSAPELGGIYPNAVKDYVSNLENFVHGYAVNRPTAVAHNDSEVIDLPGPEMLLEVSSAGTVSNILSSDSYGWHFYCAQSRHWFPHPGAGEIQAGCGGKPPTIARLNFWLDPWGRRAGVVNEEPFDARHNVRWSRLALNLVGTGILDCTLAADPAACYVQASIPFDLSVTGPTWVVGFDLVWRSVAYPTARIESGKALAIEEWLDPVINGWSKAPVQAVGRMELKDRPVAGQYQLDLRLGPEVRLDRIERIQLLSETNYWVRQN